MNQHINNSSQPYHVKKIDISVKKMDINEHVTFRYNPIY